MATLSQRPLFVVGPMGTVRRKMTRRVIVKCQQGHGSIHTVNRRAALLGSLLGVLAQSLSGPAEAAVATRLKPLADLPMDRLRLPKGGVGKDYVLVKVTVGNQGPYDFMVDSGLTGELITPHLQQTLGISGRRSNVSGLGAGGAVQTGEMVELRGAALYGGKFAKAGARAMLLPPLNAVVTPFPQEHLDPRHDPVEGMIGQEVLSLFDTDLDFPSSRIRLWSPGEGAAVAAGAGLVEIPAAVLNETGLLGIRVTSPTATRGSYQPFVGIVDCGASFSALNWAAARLIGLPPKEDARAYGSGPTIFSVGVDGRPMPLPTKKVQLTFAGEPQKGAGGGLTFAPPPRQWRSWDPVELAVGDLPIFSQLLGDGRKPFTGPAALIGLDILSQRRVMLGSGQAPGRRRQLYVGPK